MQAGLPSDTTYLSTTSKTLMLALPSDCPSLEQSSTNNHMREQWLEPQSDSSCDSATPPLSFLLTLPLSLLSLFPPISSSVYRAKQNSRTYPKRSAFRDQSANNTTTLYAIDLTTSAVTWPGLCKLPMVPSRRCAPGQTACSQTNPQPAAPKASAR